MTPQGTVQIKKKKKTLYSTIKLNHYIPHILWLLYSTSGQVLAPF